MNRFRLSHMLTWTKLRCDLNWKKIHWMSSASFFKIDWLNYTFWRHLLCLSSFTYKFEWWQKKRFCGKAYACMPMHINLASNHNQNHLFRDMKCTFPRSCGSRPMMLCTASPTVRGNFFLEERKKKRKTLHFWR